MPWYVESGTLEYNIQYADIGAHGLEVYAENSISWSKVDWKALVIEHVCDPPKVGVGSEGLTWNSPRVVKFANLMSIHGSVVTYCKADHSFV